MSKEEAKYVLGAQGNVWTEYMKTSDKVEYMAFPRMVALSEVVWSSPENKNYQDFKNRLVYFQKRLNKLEVNYANHLYEVSGKINFENNQLTSILEASTKDKEIRFSTDKSNPTINSTVYTKPLIVDKNTTLKAASFDNGKQISSVFSQEISKHKAIGKTITLSVDPNKAYNAGGKQALINGVSGSNKRYGDKQWLGFSGDDVEIMIDFGKPTKINSISTRFHNGNGQWIYAPKMIEFSFDDSKFEAYEIGVTEELLVNFHQTFKNNTAKILKIKVPNYGIIPEGKQGSGHKAWTFIDEIIIE